MPLSGALVMGALLTLAPMHSPDRLASLCYILVAAVSTACAVLQACFHLRDTSPCIILGLRYGITATRHGNLLRDRACIRALKRFLYVCTFLTVMLSAVHAGKVGMGPPRGGVSATSTAVVAAALACVSAASGSASLFAVSAGPAHAVKQYTTFSLMNMPSTRQVADLVNFAKDKCCAGATSRLQRPAKKLPASMRSTADGGRFVKDPYLRLVKTAPKTKNLPKREAMILKKLHVQEALEVKFPHSDTRYELPADCVWAVEQSLQESDLPRFRERQLSLLRQLDRKTRALNRGLLASGQTPPHVLKLLNLNNVNIILVAVLIEALEYPDVELPLRLLTGMPVAGDLTLQDSRVFRQVRDANITDKPLTPQGNPEIFEFTMADFHSSHEQWLKSNRDRMVDDAQSAIRLAQHGNTERLDLLKRVYRSTENEVYNGYMGPAMTEQQLRDKYSINSQLQARVIPRFPLTQGTKPKRCEQCDRMPNQCASCSGQTVPGLRCCDDAKRSGTNAATRHMETVRCPSFEFPARAAAEFARLRPRNLPKLILGCDDIAMAYRTVPNAQPELCVVAVYDFKRNDVSYYDVFGLNFGLASAPVQFNRVPEFICTVCRIMFYSCVDHYYDDFLVVDVADAPPAQNDGIAWTSSAQQTLHYTCDMIGFKLAPAKRKFAADQNDLLGVHCNLSQFPSCAKVSFHPTPRRVSEIVTQLQQMQQVSLLDPNAQVMSARQAASLLGRLNFILSSSYASIGRAATLPLVERSNDTTGIATWSPEFDYMLQFFVELFQHLPPLVFDFRKRKRKPVIVYTDAAYDNLRHGLGFAIFDTDSNTRKILSGQVPPTVMKEWAPKATYINQLELIAVLAAVLTFGKDCLTDRDVIFFIDNTSALSACVHGYARDTDLAAMSNLLHLALAQLQCTSWFEFVNSAANIADLPTRPQDADAAILYAQLGLTQDQSLHLPTLEELKTPRMQRLFTSCRS